MSSFWNETSERELIEVGDLAPDFALETERGESWRLSSHRGKTIALLFYPKDETLVCRRQLCSIRDNWLAYVASKVTIVGISAGTTEAHRRFADQRDLPLSLLVDTDRKVTSHYCYHWLMPVRLTRAIVIVDANGVIRHRQVILRVFRPNDIDILRSIYAAQTDYLGDYYGVLNSSMK